MTSVEEYTLPGQVASRFDSRSVPHRMLALVSLAEALDGRWIVSGCAVNRNLRAEPVSDGRRGESIPAGRYLTGGGAASVMP